MSWGGGWTGESPVSTWASRERGETWGTRGAVEFELKS
jgi:hypothetical protein